VYAKIPGALLERCENAMGNVMSMHIDWHQINSAGKERPAAGFRSIALEGQCRCHSPARPFRMTGHAGASSDDAGTGGGLMGLTIACCSRRILI
jgi:hypothetical protein